MINEKTLRVKLEVVGDGQMKASLEGDAKALDTLDTAQSAATESALALGKAQQETATRTAEAGESADQAAARIRAMVQASLQRADAEKAASAASAGTTRSTATTAAGLDRLVEAQNRAMSGTTRLMREEQQAAAAASRNEGLAQQRQELERLLGQIDPTVAALGRLDEQERQLAQYHRAGLLGTEDYTRFKNAIEESRGRIDAAGQAMHRFSLNNANARRELGYIIKDLSTGQFGRAEQSFLTLAANSGLVQLAFSATGAAIGGVLAVLGLIGVAALQAANDNARLADAVSTTGDAAGVSAGDYNQMAVAVGAATGEFGDARKAVEDLAASGKVAGAGIAGLAREAVDMATVTGHSIDQTVAKIIEMGARPSASIAKLNEQYHFLTAAEYAQIAALEAEGNKRAAARLANQLDAQAMAERAREVEANANILVRAGHSVAEAWGKAWESIKGGFVPDSLGTQVKSIKAQLDALNAPHYDRQGNELQGRFPEEVKRLQAELARLRHQQAAEGFAATERADQQQASQESIAAQQRLAQHLAPQDQLDRELKQANADHLRALRGVVDPAQRALIDREYQQQVKDARAAYEASVRKENRQTPEQSAYNTFAGKVSGLEATSIQADTTALAQYERGIARLADDMAVYMAKGGDATKAADLFNRGQQALERTLEANRTKELEGQRAYEAALAKTNAALQQQVNNQVAQVSMGQQEYERAQAVAQAYQDQAEALAQLALQRQAGQDGQAGGISQETYDADVAALQRATEQRVQIIQDGYRRMDEAQANWLNGARSAMEDYVAQAKDVAGLTRDGFGRMYADLEDDGVAWAKGEHVTLKNVEKDFEDMLARMVMRALIAQATTALLGWLGGGGGAYTSLGGSAADYSGINDGSFSGSFNFAADAGGHADGGRITGPGTGTSDSILARLSNGENVITAAATNYYGQRFMDDVNAMRLPRFAQGGPVGAAGARAAGASAGAPIININRAEPGDRVESRQDNDGRWVIDAFLTAAAQDVARGGQLGQAIGGRFGLRPTARSYAATGG